VVTFLVFIEVDKDYSFRDKFIMANTINYLVTTISNIRKDLELLNFKKYIYKDTNIKKVTLKINFFY
jgi:hypothetical protein